MRMTPALNDNFTSVFTTGTVNNIPSPRKVFADVEKEALNDIDFNPD